MVRVVLPLPPRGSHGQLVGYHDAQYHWHEAEEVIAVHVRDEYFGYARGHYAAEFQLTQRPLGDVEQEGLSAQSQRAARPEAMLRGRATARAEEGDNEFFRVPRVRG